MHATDLAIQRSGELLVTSSWKTNCMSATVDGQDPASASPLRSSGEFSVPTYYVPLILPNQVASCEEALASQQCFGLCLRISVAKTAPSIVTSESCRLLRAWLDVPHHSPDPLSQILIGNLCQLEMADPKKDKPRSGSTLGQVVRLRIW